MVSSALLSLFARPPCRSTITRAAPYSPKNTGSESLNRTTNPSNRSLSNVSVSANNSGNAFVAALLVARPCRGLVCADENASANGDESADGSLNFGVGVVVGLVGANSEF